MGAMQRCPKCQADLHRDAVRCPLCGTMVRVAALQPGARPAPIVDQEMALFEREERLLHCSSCLREYREDVRRCRPCGRDLVRCTRMDYEALLRCRPLTELASCAKAALPLLPKGLVRVGTFEGPFAADAALRELASLGLTGFLGHDGIDPAGPVGQAYLWVRSGDVTTAGYLLGRIGRGTAAEEQQRPLQAAQHWLALGKWRDALRVADAHAADAALMALAAQVLLRMGRPAEAEARVRALPVLADAAMEAERLLNVGLFSALAAVRAHSVDAAALVSLRKAAALAPRRAIIAQATLEIMSQGSERAALRTELKRLRQLCPGITGIAGFYAELAADLAKSR